MINHSLFTVTIFVPSNDEMSVISPYYIHTQQILMIHIKRGHTHARELDWNMLGIAFQSKCQEEGILDLYVKPTQLDIQCYVDISSCMLFFKKHNMI